MPVAGRFCGQARRPLMDNFWLMELLALPALNDNYVWLLHDGRQALAVAPGDSAPVLRALAAPAAPANGRLTLAGLLLTHHHADHTGGAAALHAATGAPVFGPAQVSLPAPTPAPLTVVQGGDAVPLLGLQWQVLAVPGHTATHVAYFCERVEANGVSAPLLFCGDALFSGGCGRVFEGTPAQMLASLDALAALPDATRVCCGHEYTLANLRFARAVEPDNAQLAHWQARCQALREAGRPTLPSTIGQEKAINPFLRCRVPQVASAVRRAPVPAPAVSGAGSASGEAADAVAVFAALREWKNRFS